MVLNINKFFSMRCHVPHRAKSWTNIRMCWLFLFAPLCASFEFSLVTPANGPTSGGFLITAWGSLVSTNSWNECNTVGESFGVEISTPSATFYPSLYFENKVSNSTKKQWLTFAMECSTTGGYSVFNVPPLQSGAFSGALWYSVKKEINLPRAMQDYISFPFSYDVPVIVSLQYARPAVLGGLVTIMGKNFRAPSIPLHISVGSTACTGLSLQHPHTALKCTFKPFYNGSSNQLEVSITFDANVTYAWKGFSYGDVRGIVKPTPLDFQQAWTGACTIFPFTSQSLGVRSTSLFASIHSSSCAASAWLSDTSLSCKQPAGFVLPVKSSMRISVDLAGQYRYQSTIFIEKPTCQFLKVLKANDGSFRATTGNNLISFCVRGLGNSDNSVTTRLGGSFCVASQWISDSIVTSKISVSKEQSAFVILTVSNSATPCPTSETILSPPISGKVSETCSSTTGPFFVFVNGANMRSIDHCLKMRLSLSAASITMWASDSMMAGKVSIRAVSVNTISIFFSVSRSISTSNAVFEQLHVSDVSFQGTSHSSSSFPTTGNLLLALTLSSAGVSDASSRISRSYSTCQASNWRSDSSIICKSVAVYLLSSAFSISIDAHKFNSNSSIPVLLAKSNPLFPKPFDLASSGSGMIIKIQCQNLGLFSFSRNVRLHQSACQFSYWISESTLKCKPHVVSNFLGGIFISGDTLFPSANASNSWKFYTLGNSSNVPFTGSSVLSILGSGFVSHDLTAGVSLTGSACEFTTWKSYSNLNSKVPRGKGVFAIIISLQSNRHEDSGRNSVFDFEDFSFVPFFYSFKPLTCYPTSGALMINLIGLSASNEDQSGSVRLSDTAYSLSKWISWTSLMCKTSQSALGSAPSTVVSYGVVVDVRIANLPLPTLEVVLRSSTNNLPLTGCHLLQISGANFENVDGSPKSQISLTSLESTSWISHSNIIALSSNGVGKSKLMQISVARGRSNVMSLSFIQLFTNTSVLSTQTTSVQKFPPTSGAAKVIFMGKGMGVIGISPSARVLLTACNNFPWISESSMPCKVAAGSGSSGVMVISHNFAAHIFSQSSKFGMAYAVPNLKAFSGSGIDPMNVILTGSNFAIFNSDINSVAKFEEVDGAVPLPIGSQQTQILISSDALLQGKSVKHIEVHIQVTATRLDDVVLTLETSPFIGRIHLLKNQCFGCVVKGNSTYVNMVFSDRALGYPPVTDCSNDVYLPSIPFSTLFTYSGLVFLQVVFGSTPVTFLSASISVVQSNVNIVAGQIYPSLSIKWFSDSCLDFRFPAILGTNHTFDANVDGQRSNLMTGLSYPRPIVQQETALQLIPPTGSLIVVAYGIFFGQRSNSLNMRMGKSSCSNTFWISDNKVVCKSSAGISFSDLWGTTATVSRQTSVVRAVVADNESPSLFSVIAVSGVPTTGNHLVRMHAEGLGISRFSPKAKISKSSSTSTVWISDSAVSSFTVKWKADIEMTLTVAMRSTAKIFPYFSTQNTQTFQVEYSVPRSGGYHVALSGAGFATRLLSSSARMGESGASATFWNSDSAVAFKNARIGLGSSFGVSVTVPIWLSPIITSENILTRAPSTELYGSFTFQNRSVQVSSTSVWQEYSVLNVQGQDFGFSESEKFKSLSIDPNIGCDSVRWISDTSLSTACHVNPPGSEVLFRFSVLQPYLDVQVTICQQVYCSVSHTLLQTFSARFLSSLNAATVIGGDNLDSNLPNTGSVVLLISGKDFSSVYGTIARISSTSCSDSIWRSTSSMNCRVPLGVGFRLPFFVSSIKKLSQSISEFVHHTYPSAKTSLILGSPASGTYVISPTASALGTADYSSRLRLMFSSIQAHRWVSDSFISIKISRYMMMPSVNLVLSLDLKAALCSNAQSFDVPSLSLNATVGKSSASSGAIFFSISGERLGSFGISSVVRISSSSCLESTWIADSVAKCKVPYGSGRTFVAILSGSASTVTSPLLVKESVYTEAVLKTFAAVGTLVLFEGNHFGQVSPNDLSVAQSFNILVPPNTESIILSSNALMEQRAIFSVSISITMKRVSRLDDIIIILEVFQSKNSANSLQIILFQNQCFGCIFDDGPSLSFDFTDDAVSIVPLNGCGSFGSYRPKQNKFESIYGFSGMMNLKVISASNAVAFSSASIRASRSGINLYFYQFNDSTPIPSKAITWTSDSALFSSLPAVVGQNVSIKGIMYQQNTNILHDFRYPSVVFSNLTQTFSITGATCITFRGLFFGQYDATARLRVGSSSCLSTAWISDVAVTCRSFAQGHNYEQLIMQASVAFAVGKMLSKANYDSKFLFKSFSIQPLTGSVKLSVSLFGTAVSDQTIKMRSCLSSAISTHWISDSAVNSLVQHRCRSTVITASISRQIMTFPFDIAKRISYSQAPHSASLSRTGSNLIAFMGNTFGVVSQSATARIFKSNCPSSSWISDSLIICRVPQALLIGANAFLISTDLVTFYSDSPNEIYGQPFPYESSKIDLFQFYPINQNFSLLEQLKFSSLGSNYGFATKIKVGSTYCRELMWSSQSSVACSIKCPIPYNEPFLTISMEDSDTSISVVSVNSRYLPVKYSLSSAINSYISTPPASAFEASLWMVPSFKTFQSFDISFQFSNNNTEPYMHFFTDESGVQQYLRVPIFITIKTNVQFFGSQTGNILCEEVNLLKTTMPAGERRAFLTLSNGFCASSEKVRFVFSICVTSDELQRDLFSLGQNIEIASNTTIIQFESPWFSVAMFAPFFAASSIIRMPSFVTAGEIQTMIPAFEIKTKTFCSETFVIVRIEMSCSILGFVKFSLEKTSGKIIHYRILKRSCFFVMPDWSPIFADPSCLLRVSIDNLVADSTSFSVVPSFISIIKSEYDLNTNSLTSGDRITNSRPAACYVACLQDRFGNLISDASKIAEVSAVQTIDARNISYTLNGTLRTRPNSQGFIEWCNVQVTRVTKSASLSIRVVPDSVLDTNSTFFFQSFSVVAEGFPAFSSLRLPDSENSFVGALAASDFKIPTVVVQIEDSFGNTLRFDPTLIMRISITRRSRSRVLLSSGDNDVRHAGHSHATSLIDAARDSGCIDYSNFTLIKNRRPNSNANNVSEFWFEDLRVCEHGDHVLRMDVGHLSRSVESTGFVPSVPSVGDLIFSVTLGSPSMVYLTHEPFEYHIAIQTYSLVNSRLFVECLDSGFNLVNGSATISFQSDSGIFNVLPSLIQIDGERTMTKNLWLSGFRDLDQFSSQDSLKISSSSLKIVPSLVDVVVDATCSPGTYAVLQDNIPASLQCIPCQPGSFSSGWDSKKCNPCSTGTFVASDARSCIMCPVGTATNMTGSVSCRKCSIFYFSNTRGTECVSLIFTEVPSFNIIPFTPTPIPPIQLYDEISHQPRNSVQVHVKIICLKRFNCTSRSDIDGVQIFSKAISIPSGQRSSQAGVFSIESACGSSIIGSNFRWSIRMEATDQYPSIEVFDGLNLLINKCPPSIETIDPPAPKPKAVFGITLSEIVTLIGIDFGIQSGVLRFIPGYPYLSPQMCIFSCRPSGSNDIITSSSIMIQNLALIDTFECRTNFSFGMKIGDHVTVDVSLFDGRSSNSKVKLQTVCPAMFYLSETDAAHGCEKCPYPQSLTREANKPSIEDCKCNIGYYGRFGLECSPCPQNHPGFDCVNFGSRWPQIKAGFYIEYSRMKDCVSTDDCNAITECLYSWACPGDDELSCLGSLGADTCYEGRGCYKCCRRYYMDDKNMCNQCDPVLVSYLILAGAIMAPFILAALAQAAITPARKVAIDGILTIVAFFQSVTNVNVVQIPWPNFVDEAFGFLKFFSFGLSAIKEECSVYLEPVTKLFLMAALPFAISIFMVSISAYKAYWTLEAIRIDIDKIPERHKLVSITRHNNILDLFRCLFMDVFSLHPGFVPNSFFAAFSVTVRERSETIIRMSATFNVTSKKQVASLKKKSKLNHRGMLFKPHDYYTVAAVVRESGVQQSFLQCAILLRQRISGILSIFIVTLQGTLSALLGTFRCIPLNQKMVLVSDPEIVCDGSSDALYQSMLIVSILGCIWCGFVTPMIMSAILRSKWCRQFALRNNEHYQEMFDCIVADISSSNYLFVPGTMIRTSMTLCVVIFIQGSAQQLLAQIIFNFVDLTYLLIARPYLVKISNDIEQINCMASFVVILSGLLFIAQVDGQMALEGTPRDVLGMFVVAVLMVSTFIIVTSVIINVVSNLLLQSQSMVGYWWKAFVVFLDEGVLKQLSGYFFGLQMSMFSPLTTKLVKETSRMQRQNLIERLKSVEDKLNDQYMLAEGSYFRSASIMKVLHKMAVKKAHRLQEEENSSYKANVADFKNISSLPEIQSVGSIHQILFNKHPDRINDKDPPQDYKHFALTAIKTLDSCVSDSAQPVLLAHLLLAEEGVAPLGEDSIEYGRSISAKWKQMQMIIAKNSGTIVALTDFDESQRNKWSKIFRPVEYLLFAWNMGFDMFSQFKSISDKQPDKHVFGNLNSIFKATHRIKSRTMNMIGYDKQELEPRDEDNLPENEMHNTTIEKPKWGLLREQLLTETTKSPIPDRPTPRDSLLKNTIDLARLVKKPAPKPSEKGGFKIRATDNRLTNVPVSNEWIIEYSILKRQWQVKHLNDRGNDSCVAFLDTTAVLSQCRNLFEWQLWNGDPHNRRYNGQTTVSVDIVVAGKPDAKSVRFKGFFARLRADIEGDAIFWQFASSLNGEYSNLGLISNNRFVYFNSSAATTYLAAEKAKELEVQAARFGHASGSAKTSGIVGRRIISNKRFNSSVVNQQQSLNVDSKTSAAAAQLPPALDMAIAVQEKAGASIAQDAWSNTSGDEPDIEGDE